MNTYMIVYRVWPRKFVCWEGVAYERGDEQRMWLKAENEEKAKKLFEVALLKIRSYGNESCIANIRCLERNVKA